MLLQPRSRFFERRNELSCTSTRYFRRQNSSDIFLPEQIDLDEDASGQAKRLAPATHSTTTIVDAIMVQVIGS